MGEGKVSRVVRGRTIKNLTVQNGPDGVLARHGAAVILDHVTAQDNADDGIQTDETSTAQITNCTVLHNGNDGILVKCPVPRHPLVPVASVREAICSRPSGGALGRPPGCIPLKLGSMSLFYTPISCTGQISTCKGAAWWWSRGGAPGVGKPCDASMVAEYDRRVARHKGHGAWKMRAR